MAIEHLTERKMTPEFKAKWLEALRSGRYAQGRCYLRTGANEFCCMGVALDLIDSTQWRDPYKSQWGDMVIDWKDLRAGDTTEALADAIGLLYSDVKHLAIVNDREGQCAKDFLQIAEWIEENV